MNKLKRIGLVVAMAMIQVLAYTRDNLPADNDVMKSNGKIYVVMTVVIVIVAGLLLYLVNLDRKISKIEREELIKN